ncbi:uncharacterized protein LOC131655084 isoform X2 [Vicia villosa]|uniref:uncharacterized protein LOC131655084 isoform X2 n=1 Tax=Vicia villosa TaxID=3911 RepID=UPI00273C848A|nr:uncharacterized protein LOC131655084 isoform X2 [Vicia villosa]
MSLYDGVVIGKLRLKGKPLAVKNNGIKKKKKHRYSSEFNSGNMNEGEKYEGEGNSAGCDCDDDRLTPAERRFLQQTEKIELQRVGKMATRSHRDRIERFNQYLANLTDHYDIPKVGPG